MANTNGYDNFQTIAQAIVKVAALIALVAILYIDMSSGEFDAKEVELILAGFVAGSEAFSAYRKTKG